VDALVCVIIALVVVVLVPALWGIAIYNRLTGLRQTIRDSWAGIDVELKRRYDLIPNLVETVRGYASHESETLAHVIELRNRAMNSTGSLATQAVDEDNLLRELRMLFVRVEAYPELKANTNFLALQSELANTEDRIAASRRFFNGNVRTFNSMCQTFPTNLLASMFGFKPESYFELKDENERIVPRVNVGGSTSNPPPVPQPPPIPPAPNQF